MVLTRRLEGLGASLADVVRTRVLLIQIEDCEVVAQVHGELFGEIRPATTIMQVGRFIDPDWLIEVEADAIAESA
jgi:enamine deaminase RidA (YjgF/YER057c/UK114 family)